MAEKKVRVLMALRRLIAGGLASAAVVTPALADDHAARRKAMVAEILADYRAHGGTGADPHVMAAMGRVPRHEFVPPQLAERAYENRPLPIGEDQTISQPYIV